MPVDKAFQLLWLNVDKGQKWWVRIPQSPLITIFKEVQSPQILDWRAFLILLFTQIAPSRSKN